MFKKSSLKSRLLWLVGVQAMFIIAIGVAGMMSMLSVVSKFEHVADVNFANSIALSGMRHSATEITRYNLRMVIPGMSHETMKESVKIGESFFEKYDKFDKQYNAIPFVEGEEEIYKTQNAAFQTWAKLIKTANALAISDHRQDHDKFLDMIRKDLPAAKVAHQTAFEKLSEFQDKEGNKWQADANQTAHFARMISIALTTVGTFLAFLIGFVFARSLSASLKSMSTEIFDSSVQVGSASHQLSTASQQLSAGSTEAASSLEETVASVEELSSMVKLNADNAKEAASLSTTSKQSAEQGEVEMKKLTEAMTEISESSKKIEEIINVIDDIAFQTNLLALNAAVEAARAGDQGRGFAVVAEAVRTLAQRSATAAKDITTLIKDSVSKIERGSKAAGDGARVLNGIVTTVKKVADLNTEIASASQEQSNGLNQISKAMTELDQATQRNASSAEETASASEELSSQATMLESTVVQLNLLIDGTTTAQSAAPATKVTKTHETQKRIPQPTTLKSRRPVLKIARANATSSANMAVVNANHDAADNAAATIPFDEEKVPMGKVGTTAGF